MNAADVLRGALERLGPNGERWNQVGAHADPIKMRQGRCVYSALVESADRDHGAAQRSSKFIEEELGLTAFWKVWGWNDDARTTWEDVHLVLKRALARAESEGL